MPHQPQHLSKKSGLLVIACFMLFSSLGQGRVMYRPGEWKKYRNELAVGFGASNFLGELGGRDRIASPFLLDLEFSMTNFASHLDYRYYLSRKTALRLSGFYGQISGDDKLTQEPFRNNRNLHFKSLILEGSLIFEYYFPFDKDYHRYGLRTKYKKKKYGGGRLLGIKAKYRAFYIFGGIGGFYFNPKAQLPTGEWLELKPLSTEGQGLPGGIAPYSNYSVAFPVGFGYKHGFSKQFGVLIELGYRFTLTDYIDDVSDVYYDNAQIAAAKGPEAAYLANPTNNSIPTWTDGAYTYDPTGTGMQRGDPTDRDGYMFATIGIYYKFENNSAYRKKKKRIQARF